MKPNKKENKNQCLTFRQLIDKQHSHLIKVNCNKKVNVLIQKMMPTNKQFSKRKGRVLCIVAGKNEYTLKTIFQTYQTDKDNQEYVLVHRRNQCQKQKYSSRGKSLSNKSQTSIRTYSSNKLAPQKYKNQEIREQVSPRKKMHSFFSQKIIKNELKDYLPKDKNCLKKNLLQEQTNNKKGQILFYKDNNQTFDKQPFKNEEQLQKTDQKQEQKLLNAKFSFGQIMKMGLIQEQSFKDKQSFKIAGDQSIERLKLPQAVSVPNGLRSFEELSSIISNVKDQTKKDMDMDSIKNDIQKLNQCSIPKDKLFYKKLTNQTNNQNVMNNNKESKQNEPFKFRKKEEVVKHLVNAKIIFKESNSINIS